MKAIVISDHAKYCVLMMNGDKTIEVRKANEHMEYIKSLWNNGGLSDKDDYDEVRLTKAPQSFAYIKVEE